MCWEYDSVDFVEIQCQKNLFIATNKENLQFYRFDMDIIRDFTFLISFLNYDQLDGETTL